jgi:hypothetical protein
MLEISLRLSSFSTLGAVVVSQILFLMRSLVAVASLLIFRFLFKGQSLWVVLKWVLPPHLHVVGAILILSFLGVVFFVVVVSDVSLLCFFRIPAVKPIPVPYALLERSFNTCCRFFCCSLLLLTFTSTLSSYFFLYSFSTFLLI